MHSRGRAAARAPKAFLICRRLNIQAHLDPAWHLLIKGAEPGASFETGTLATPLAGSDIFINDEGIQLRACVGGELAHAGYVTSCACLACVQPCHSIHVVQPGRRTAHTQSNRPPSIPRAHGRPSVMDGGDMDGADLLPPKRRDSQPPRSCAHDSRFAFSGVVEWLPTDSEVVCFVSAKGEGDTRRSLIFAEGVRCPSGRGR